MNCLVIDLAARGFRLNLKDGKIMVSPAKELTPDERARLAEERDDVVSMLGLDVELLDSEGAITTQRAGVPIDAVFFFNWRFKGDLGWCPLPRRPHEHARQR